MRARCVIDGYTFDYWSVGPIARLAVRRSGGPGTRLAERNARKKFFNLLWKRREQAIKLHPSHHIITEEGLQVCGVLTDDLLKDCVAKLPRYEDFYRMKPVSKPMKQLIESKHFQFIRGEALLTECSLTVVHFTENKSGGWEGSGFDLMSKQWRRLPPQIDLIPSQAVDSSSQTSHLIAAGGGLLCSLDLSNFLGERSVTVCNPCTLTTKALPPLPPLRLSWKPKLLLLISDPRTTSYQVIVAGHTRTGGVSSIDSVIYDSTTSTWTTATSPILGTDLRFKQYQTGSVVERRLYCIAVDGHETKHVLQFNLENCTWSVRRVPLPGQQNATQLFRPTDEAQLVECNGNLYLFSRRGYTRKEQSLYRLVQPSTADPHWEHLWMRPEESGKVAEYTCVPFGEDKLCIFNTEDVTGFVYDIHAHSFSELPSRYRQVSAITYGIENHLGFMLQLNFKQKP